ncbi:hydroxyethylthiazole kinase [Methanospirillum lacunae]|uniref:Hydroxyethylthiazole kinase n=1 Tax=Methanospirillum lacunae TaxID=668570 RepID=A0A2V2N7J0_9EURY|nr:hydroxyethylthiazole kinase [Methanospirillum lacunae]PWR72197.1 hydroxyethylthiazole kinase [Methanospirillum lacunae]
MQETPYSKIFATARTQTPLIHHITNYVTVNDCANITLCAGGAPVMAHSTDEIEEMVQYAGALVLNIGTLDLAQIESMLLVGKAAGKRDIPIILDPVGAGATTLRTNAARRLMTELQISVLKGNAGEIGVLAGVDAKVRGVDSAGISGDPVSITTEYAGRSGMTIVMSGQTDIVSDGTRTLLVENGHPLMGAISGTGCMAASVTGVFAASGKDRVTSSTAALAAFGIAGERAATLAKGPGSFKVALFDSLAALTPDDLAEGARIRTA